MSGRRVPSPATRAAERLEAAAPLGASAAVVLAAAPTGAKEALPPEIHADLVETLFGTTASFISGLFGGLIVPAVAMLRDGKPIFLACTLITLALAIFRVGVFLAHRRTPVEVRRARARLWEVLYSIGGVGFMTAVGVTAAILLAHPLDELTSLYGIVIVLGCAGSLAGRNAGRPHIVFGQIVGLCAPVACVLTVKSDGWYIGLSAILGLVVISVRSTTHFLNGMLVTALLSGREAHMQRKRLATALNSMSHGLCMAGRDGTITVINQRLLDFFALGETTATTIGQLTCDIAASGHLGAEETAAFTRSITAHVAQRGSAACTQQIGARVFQFRSEPMENGGSVMVVEDVTEARRSAAQVERLAHFDTLTGLANRFQFHQLLKEQLAGLTEDGLLALFTIDLDRFKEVNDTLGHPMGDKLLRHVAQRLLKVVGPDDIVARFGGDEFQLLLRPRAEGAAVEAIDALASRIVCTISRPYRIDGHAISIGASLGIALAPRDSLEADDLLKCADMALYAAKAASRGTFRHFMPSLDAAAQRKRRVEGELRDALARNELEVHYQPMIDVRTGLISTCEALVRWRHPVRGLVPPDQFIPVAEETGLIADLGDFVLRQACVDAADWPNDIKVAVNMSGKQFLLRQDLVERIDGVLAATGLPPHRLEVEITESTLVDAREPLAQLSARGIRISLDDFGTGYSSLSYLRQFPVHKIKIDRGFIKMQDEVSLAIIDAVSFLASALHVDLVVEGVETRAQLGLLMDRRIHLIQGFLFSRPRPLAELAPLLGGPFAPQEPAPLRNVA